MQLLSGRLICIGDSEYPVRQRAAVHTIVVHRCGVGKGLAQAVAAYRDVKKHAAGWYTNGKWPYHFYVLPDGTIYDCLPLTFIAPAALKTLNRSGVHIALEGDFTKEKPTPAQAAALKGLVAFLRADLHRPTMPVRGHTDEAGASSDPNKQCPGHKLKLPQ